MNYDQNIRGQDSSLGTLKEDASATLKSATQNVQQQAKQKIDSQRDTAAEQIQAVEHAIKAAADDLREHDNFGLSQYVTEIADGVGSFARNLKQKSVDELVHDVEAIARRNPTLFIAGSIAVGLGIARFAKSSSQRRHTSDSRSGDYSEHSARWADETYLDAPTSENQYSSNYSGSSTGFASPDRSFSSSSVSDRYPADGEGFVSSASEADYAADDFAGAANTETGAGLSSYKTSHELSFNDDDTEEFQRSEQRKTTSGFQNNLTPNRSTTNNNLSNGGKRYE